MTLYDHDDYHIFTKINGPIGFKKSHSFSGTYLAYPSLWYRRNQILSAVPLLELRYKLDVAIGFNNFHSFSDVSQAPTLWNTAHDIKNHTAHNVSYFYPSDALLNV